MELPIPKKFQILGHTYKVKLLKKVNGGKDHGEVDDNKKIVRLERESTEQPLSKVEETWLHEMVHAILDELAYHKLSDDEIFVERFSKALHQALKTSE